MRRMLWLTFVVLVACAPGRPDARSVEGQVWSPYCPGRLLTDCPTQQAHELREQISKRIARGDSEDEVLTWVRREFGEGAIARPDTSGSGLIVWLVPAAIFVAGALVVWRFVSRNVERTSRSSGRKEETHADP